jgi:1-deoxy-D-xylulose-5-phosphate synthase
MDRSGVVGRDGPTHHGAFDLSYLRLIPNMTIMAPKDENELRDMIFTGVKYEEGPVAIRYPKGAATGVEPKKEIEILPIGVAEVLSQGKDVALFAIGSMVYPCLAAAQILSKSGIHVAVVNARFAQPIDEETVKSLSASTGRVVTVEENVLRGGFGSGVLEVLERNGMSAIETLRLGLPDRFLEHASRDKLLDRCRLTPEGIAESITKRFFTRRKSRPGSKPRKKSQPK